MPVPQSCEPPDDRLAARPVHESGVANHPSRNSVERSGADPAPVVNRAVATALKARTRSRSASLWRQLDRWINEGGADARRPSSDG